MSPPKTRRRNRKVDITNAKHPARAQRWTLFNIGIAAVLASMLLLASAASAARDPIASGATDLHMKKGFLRKLSNAAITA